MIQAGGAARDYEGVAAESRRRLSEAVALERLNLAALGARLFGEASLAKCMASAARDAADSLCDAGLLGVAASRTGLLDWDEKLRDCPPSPRAALKAAVAAALLHDLESQVAGPAHEGHDLDTLPSVAQGVLDALAALESSGRRYRFAANLRERFESGDWHDVGTQALAVHVAAFLDESGRPGPAYDLTAAMASRRAVETAATPLP